MLGAVPRRLIWDSDTGIGRGKSHADGVAAFAGTLNTTVQRLEPVDPESKGVVERRDGYQETSFIPGRTVTSPVDFDTRFTDWLAIANGRTVRTIRARPVDPLDLVRVAMLPLPPVAPTVGWGDRVRLGRDHRVRLDSDEYSVDPSVIGRCVDVAAGLSSVDVRNGVRLVATRDRAWARGQTVTDPANGAVATILREQHQWPWPAAHEEVGPDLADHDRAHGLTVREEVA